MIDPSTLEAIADGLAESGFVVVENFLPPGKIDDILSLDEFNNFSLHFSKAAIGKTGGKQINENIRGDYILWLDHRQVEGPLAAYTQNIYQLIEFVNRSLFLSLKDFEMHLTAYPAGTFYKRHYDQFKKDDHRKLSVIFYLNREWLEDHGGALRVYLPEGPADILPKAGRLVCFRSDLIEHEVLPATRERLSITGWLLDQLADVR